MITLKEAKNYLRVDFDEDDRLISDLLLTAKKLCMDVGRMTEEQFEENEDTTRTAMLFTADGSFYALSQKLAMLSGKISITSV